MNEHFFQELREQKLSNEARTQIMAACRAEIARTRHTSSRAAGIIIAAAVITAATLTVGAIGSATAWFGLRGKTESHFVDDPDIVITQPDALATVDSGTDAPLELRCDAVTGGGNQLYLSLSLTRTDGSDVITVEDGETLLHIDFPNTAITLADGTARKVYITPLGDSTSVCVHLEGSALLYNADLVHIGQPATLTPGEMLLTIQNADGTLRTCTYGTPSQPMTISLDYRNDTLDGEISPVTIQRDGITVTLNHITMTNAELTLSGICDAPNGTEIPWISTLLAEAYLTLSDDTTVLCGTKNGCGTMPDGSFILNWILDKAVDASKVDSLTLDGKTINLN